MDRKIIFVISFHLPPFFLFVSLLFSCQKSFSLEGGDLPKIIDSIKNIVSFDSTDFVLFDSTSGIPQNEQLQGIYLFKQKNNPQFANKKYQAIPSIGIDKNGVLFVAWYSGGIDEAPGNYILLAVSTDKGQTWREKELIIYPTASNVRYLDPCFFNDKYNNLHLFWAKSSSPNLPWDKIGGVWYSKISYVNDTMRINKPYRISDGVMLNKPINTFDKNKIIFPIPRWLHLSDNPNIDKIYNYVGVYGEKKLVSFSQYSILPIANNIRYFDESQIVQLKDSSYLAMIRTKDGIYYTKSNDMLTWSESKKFTGIGNIGNARFYLGKLKSGNLILIANNSIFRENLKAFVSIDDGKTWKYSLMIDNRSIVNTSGLSYPDMVEDSTGRIYVCYDFDRYGQGIICLASFTEDDVLKNNNNSVIKSVVSKLK